ncbi:uncharacterized protein DUF4221 [Algoriphagus aquaeductus]|uniref:Uncharacterized protein DUF4221 n=2 Tax=Algoriphagus aquaeductus TaxID=475299 RepID=A0A326RWM2_9BACT|nr:uncharacterized protein DUF4221 [Algoriphagus aquaeductus]
MRKLAVLFLLPLIFSCGGSSSEKAESGNILENLTYTVDTVVVNAKGRIFDLSMGIHNSSISSDLSTFYHFDIKKFFMNEVNLNRLELTGIHPFTTEGPDGVGFNPPRIQSLGNDRVFMASTGIGAGIFSKSGKKEKSLKFNFREIDGLTQFEEGLITNQVILSDDEKYMFSTTRNLPSNEEVFLYVIDTENKSGKNIALPALNLALESTIWLVSGNSGTVHQEAIFTQLVDGKIYISSTVTSDVYYYNYLQDSLQLFEFPHQLVNPKKTGSVQRQYSDEKPFDLERAKLLYQTGFEKLLWDDERNQFFRFARKPIPDEERKWYERADIYLFAYDKDLNLLGEKYLPELNEVPEFPFFKDGKLWSYVNVEDELGFAVIDFKF